MKTYESAIGVRGDCLYCPLPLSVDSYWNCLTDCHHCYMRRLNRTWGTDLRPSDPKEIKKKLLNGLRNDNPKSSLAYALKLKKTIRVGNKTDPYQNAEKKYCITKEIIKTLIVLDWTFVVQSRFTHNMGRDNKLFAQAKARNLIQFLIFITPGMEKDWEILERKRTTTISDRLKHIQYWMKRGYSVGINGEPFIPGYHTIKDFRDTLKRLRSTGINTYNIYNLHLNDWVAKRFVEIGLDLEKIWHMNQDKQWKPILTDLCRIADEMGIRMGCPDFVNSPPKYRQYLNTCCGLSVPNPSRFNTHWWKQMMQKKKSVTEIIDKTWEGIGDKKQGEKVLEGVEGNFYTMKDAGLL